MSTWSERDGRADIEVRGYGLIETLAHAAVGIIILCACIWTIGGLS